MALFKGRDENLPISTRLYQVVIPEGWKDDPSILLRSEMGILFRHFHGIPEGYPPDETHDRVHIQMLTSCASLAENARRIMNAAADATPIQAETLQWLIHLYSAMHHPSLYVANVDILKLSPATQVCLDSVNLVHSDMEPLFRLERWLTAELWSVVVHPDSVWRCRECSNPYLRLRGRDDSPFCSHRCNMRFVNRGYRARKKSQKEILDMYIAK